MSIRVRRRFSQSAIWSRTLGRFVFPIFFIAAILFRVDAIEALPTFVLFGFSWMTAALSVLTAVIALVTIWRHGLYGLNSALAGLALSLPIFILPFIFGGIALGLPKTTDVSTDVFDPPAFLDLTVRGPKANKVAEPKDFAWQAQLDSYPDISPLFTGKSAEDVFLAVKETMADLSWQIVAEKIDEDVTISVQDELDAPVQEIKGKLYKVQAVARSLFLGFRDDVVVSIKPTQQNLRLDIRSVSRIGEHDFGTNARRIREFLEDLQEKLNPGEQQ